MSPLARFLLLRLLLIPLTLLVVTATLMGLLTAVPPQVRALLYLPKRALDNVFELNMDELRQVTDRYIQLHHLEDPFPVQYADWVVSVFTHGGGYSPTAKGDVFDALLRRTPVTAELTLYSLLTFIPLGIVSGLRAGWKPGGFLDKCFRIGAYIATSLPPFITALVLLGIFYVFLGWFPPGRLGTAFSQEVLSPKFHLFTGLMTIDSLLNGRLDIFIDSVRHLVLPVVTVSLLYWATLSRIVRSTIINERRKEYLTAARARGIPEKRLLWRHALRNVLSPALSSSALAAASLFTGIFMIEIIFDLKGVADLVVHASSVGLDVPIAMGFSVYAICIILVIMFVLDVLRAILDPRSREGIIYDHTR
ncbi:MAG: ABC transporter permease [Chloroflexi bacterium]|nr:ABC transporter permease [Chloroflexota bacterium]